MAQLGHTGRVLEFLLRKLVIAARRLDRLEQVKASLEKDGADVLAVRCDVADERDVDELVKATLDRHGQVDVLVNNAGVTNIAPALEEPLDQFRQTVEINIASVLGLVGTGLIPQAGYTASKGGVVNMTREIAAQWARLGVRVNAIAPGWFPSEMTTDMFSGDDGKRFIRKRTPLGRGGDPTELIGPLLLLASDASSYTDNFESTAQSTWTRASVRGRSAMKTSSPATMPKSSTRTRR